MNRCIRLFGSVAVVCGFAWALVACGGDSSSDEDATPSSKVTVTGAVQAVSQNAQPSALSGADVIVKVDHNGDGEISDSERWETQTESEEGAEGEFAVEVAAESGQRLVVTVRSSGYGAQHETVDVSDADTVRVDTTLYSMEPLDCQGSRCRSDDGALEVQGLPQDVTGSGRVFNPETNADAFPGEFEDAGGNMLISGVFATIELNDASGEEIKQLEEPATLEMRFPKDTWDVIRDVDDSNSRIDVPLYAFGENTGEWTRDAEGYLVDGEGETIPDSEISAIRSGDYEGVIYAKGEVEHMSTWNVDWPVESHGCLQGTVLGPDGNPAVGAQIVASGLTYTGTSSAQTIGDDGTFCVDVMRSEGSDEDIDGNGETGETHRVGIHATWEGELYELGEQEMPEAQATCGEEGCAELGERSLTEENKLSAAICSFEARVLDFDGEPVEGASVSGYDSSLPGDVWSELCLEEDSFENNCTYFASTNADGVAEVEVPVIYNLSLRATATDVNPEADSSYRTGSASTRGCPDEPVDVRLTEGTDFFELSISRSGQQIEWTPAIPAQHLSVSDDEGPKWWIYAQESPFEPPVTFGEVPEGATDLSYLNDELPRGELSAGDEIGLYGTTTSDRGVFEWYSGQWTVD